MYWEARISVYSGITKLIKSVSFFFTSFPLQLL